MSSNPNMTWPQIKCADCGVDEETHQNLGLCEDGDCGHGRDWHGDDGTHCYRTTEIGKPCPCMEYTRHAFKEPTR